MSRRVVITGLGTVTPLGVGIEALWDAMTAGRSGLGPITIMDASGLSSRLGGEVRDFSAKDHVPKGYRKAVKVMARDIELAVAAAKAAVEDARLVTRSTAEETGATTTYAGERVGCQIGAGLIAAETEELSSALATAASGGSFSLRAWGESGIANLQPLWLLKYLPNMLACHVTIIHGAEGPSNTICCGEASGLLSIGESARVIERDAADLCFAGGAESKLHLMGMLRAAFAGRLAETGDATDPAPFVRPFDPHATGSLIGEAGGIAILEESASASARGASAYAEIVGFGAAHSPAPPYTPAGERSGPGPGADRGRELAIRRALADADIGPEAIDAIVPAAHGSAWEDQAEAGSLRAVFGPRLAQIPLVTLTPFIGNTFAGSGGVAVAVAAMALRRQQLPARLHGGTPAAGLLVGPASARHAALRHILVCSSSLGGQNAAAVLRHCP